MIHAYISRYRFTGFIPLPEGFSRWIPGALRPSTKSRSVIRPWPAAFHKGHFEHTLRLRIASPWEKITFPWHPGRLIWNILIRGFLKSIFLSTRVICMFHVNLPGCSRKVTFESMVFRLSLSVGYGFVPWRVTSPPLKKGPPNAPKRKPASRLVWPSMPFRWLCCCFPKQWRELLRDHHSTTETTTATTTNSWVSLLLFGAVYIVKYF